LVGHQERNLQVMNFDHELTMLPVDTYVGYELTRAMVSYVLGIYEEPIFLCGLAIEEQLSLGYEQLTTKYPNRKYTRTNRSGVTTTFQLTDMKFNGLIDWARNEGGGWGL
jgi:hypothetical protein